MLYNSEEKLRLINKRETIKKIPRKIPVNICYFKVKIKQKKALCDIDLGFTSLKKTKFLYILFQFNLNIRIF